MKLGERRGLYRSCRHLIAILLLLICGGALRAQHTDPLPGNPAGLPAGLPAGRTTTEQPLDDRSSGPGVAEWSGTSHRAGSYGKLQAGGDTTVITPGKRDFLEPNAPNPFGSGSASTRISYSIAEESHVQIKVYDFFYEEVATLVDSLQPAGYYTVIFDPKGRIPSGMYFYELKTERTRELRRMVYVK